MGLWRECSIHRPEGSLALCGYPISSDRLICYPVFLFTDGHPIRLEVFEDIAPRSDFQDIEGGQILRVHAAFGKSIY